MALSRKSKSTLTPEQYLQMERKAETKSEYWTGEIYAMAGASRRHNTIVANAIAGLVVQLRGRSCNVYPSDMRLGISATGLFTYPDLSIVCGKGIFEDRRGDTLLNPTVIVEVLSPSTEAYDRGAKFEHYRQLPSLTDYLLVAQERAAVDHFVRQADDNWLLMAHQGLDAVVQLASIDCTLALSDIYDKVDWSEDDEARPPLRVIDEDAVDYDDSAEDE